MRNKRICGIDIGSHKVCVSCAEVLPSGELDLLGVSMLPSQGIKAGRIIDVKKLSACVRGACANLRKNCGVKIKKTYVNIDNLDLKLKSTEDVSLDRKIIHSIEQPFLDKAKFNPTYISALIPAVDTLTQTLKFSGLALEEMVFSGCVQAAVFFKESDSISSKKQILIDIGAGLTKIALFKGNVMCDMKILSLGAQSITEAIARELKVSIDCAEELKIKHGRLDCHGLSGEKIIIKDGSLSKIIFRDSLCKVIALNVEQLLSHIKTILFKFNSQDTEFTEIIVTGGGAALEGLLERIEAMLNRSVKMGFLYQVKDRHIQAQSVLYATSIGLIYFAHKRREHMRTNFGGTRLSPIKNLFNRAYDLYQEYF